VPDNPAKRPQISVRDAFIPRKRSLTTGEIDYARDIFADSLDYSAIRLTRGSLFAMGSPVTLGATIHLKAAWGLFDGDGLELTRRGRQTLIHEMVHVWQYQNGGLAYIPLSLTAQMLATLRGGDRGGAYNWRAAHDGQRPWSTWNPEQQAAAVEDYNKLLRKTHDGTATPAQAAELAVLGDYIGHVRRCEGATGSRRRIFRHRMKK
jgi:hypothetical protein